MHTYYLAAEHVIGLQAVTKFSLASAICSVFPFFFFQVTRILGCVIRAHGLVNAPFRYSI